MTAGELKDGLPQPVTGGSRDDALGGPASTPSDASLTTQKIKTEHVYPPIPVRSFDWCAWFDGMDEETRGQGWGKTKAEAIANLKEMYGIECRCGKTAQDMAFTTCIMGGCHIGADL